MTWPLATKAALVLLAVLVAAYDVLAIWRAGPDASVSRVCLAWAERYPLFPFALGVLVGHLFSSQRP